MIHVIFYFLTQHFSVEIFFNDYFSGTITGEIGGIQHLVIVGCIRERDKNCRFSQGCDLGHRCRPGPANDQVRLAVLPGHISEKGLSFSADRLIPVGVCDRLLIRLTGLMHKMQALFVSEVIQRFYDCHVYPVGALAAADNQNREPAMGGVLCCCAFRMRGTF